MHAPENKYNKRYRYVWEGSEFVKGIVQVEMASLNHHGRRSMDSSNLMHKR